MGIHASDNLSHLAHQTVEPREPDRYDYDEYVIIEDGRNGPTRTIMTFDISHDMWERARNKFLHLYNVEKRAVKLLGRVFN